MSRSFIAFGLLLVGVVAAAPPDMKEAPSTHRNRRDLWQQYLEKWDFDFRPQEASAVYCFGQYTGTTRLQMVFDSKNRHQVAFRFGDDGKLLERHGYGGTVFKESNNVLYFAKYPPNSQGCTVTAYDLSNGKRLWETPLDVLEMVTHSAYRNAINLDVLPGPYGKDPVLCVTGQESYGDYLAILDRETGEVLARRVYREGYK